MEGRHSDEVGSVVRPFALLELTDQRVKVTAAAKKALEEFKRAHPEIDEKDLHVDLPPPPPAPGPSRPGAPAHLPMPPQLPVFAGVPGPNAARAQQQARFAYAQQQQQQHLQLQLRLQEQQRLRQALLPGVAQGAGPVFNFQVHINHHQAAVGPAQPQPGPVFAPVMPPLPAIAPVRVRARRPARARARR